MIKLIERKKYMEFKFTMKKNVEEYLFHIALWKSLA